MQEPTTEPEPREAAQLDRLLDLLADRIAAKLTERRAVEPSRDAAMAGLRDSLEAAAAEIEVATLHASFLAKAVN